MVRLGPNRYGKAEVRVVNVGRGLAPDGGDVVRDWSVSTSLSGDLSATHLAGDNRHVVATDTQKNAITAFAHRLGNVEPETLALALGRHFVGEHEYIGRARVAIEEYPWVRLGRAPHSFARSGQYVRTTTVVVDGELGVSVVSGVERLVVLNTTNSEFWGFARDALTTLPETKDRMLATEANARWRYRTDDDAEVDWSRAWTSAYQELLAAFSETYSYSLQQTLFAMGRRVIEAVPAICEVRLALPNKHHYLVDLEPFGLENENQVYYATDRPYGLIEGTVLADDAPDEPLAWD
jgi:urate oxidase